ncbi:MAG: hypothetical protein NT075_24880 [Chloroflexi bacterium]|nr:hypothetical protein [Chloroflexota bacterium]
MFNKKQFVLKYGASLCLFISLACWAAHVYAIQSLGVAMPSGSTWGVRTQFIAGSGSLSMRQSGDYYQHTGSTSGFNISGSGQQTPALVKIKTQSYELSDIKTTPCNNRTTGITQSYSSVNNSTSLQSGNPCGGSDKTVKGWHSYYGNGFHWIGSLYGTTDKLN